MQFNWPTPMQQNPISVLIIEDEEIWSTHLVLSLTDLGFTIAGVFNTAAEALGNIGKINFDIALLDINMEGQNIGITLGKMIQSTYHKPFIFITGSTDNHTANEAIEANPSAYLIKPVNDTSLFIAINTAINNFQQKNSVPLSSNYADNYFFVKTGNSFKKIEWATVFAMQSDKKYTRVFVKNDLNTYLLNSTLKKAIQAIIPANMKNIFVQINRSDLVNINHIESLKEFTVSINQLSFEATEGYLKDLKKALNIG